MPDTKRSADVPDNQFSADQAEIREAHEKRDAEARKTAEEATKETAADREAAAAARRGGSSGAKPVDRGAKKDK
jgi:hypothetical protein